MKRTTTKAQDSKAFLFYNEEDGLANEDSWCSTKKMRDNGGGEGKRHQKDQRIIVVEKWEKMIIIHVLTSNETKTVRCAKWTYLKNNYIMNQKRKTKIIIHVLNSLPERDDSDPMGDHKRKVTMATTKVDLVEAKLRSERQCSNWWHISWCWRGWQAGEKLCAQW